jgi:hypothetical protein
VTTGLQQLFTGDWFLIRTKLTISHHDGEPCNDVVVQSRKFRSSIVTQFSGHLGCNDLNDESRIRMRNRLSAGQPDQYILEILQENRLESI